MKKLATPFWIVLGKLLCLAQEVILTSKYGAGDISDAFILAISIPTILFEGVVMAAITSYIPIYNEIALEGDSERLDKYNNNIKYILFIAGLLLAAILLLFPKWTIGAYGSGLTSSANELYMRYSKWAVLAIPLLALSGMYRGFLQMKGESGKSVASQIIIYTILIAAIIFSYPNYISLIGAFLAANAASLVFFLVSSVRKGYRIRFYISLREPYIRQIGGMILPIFISEMVGEINSIIDKYMASSMGTGVVTSLSYAYKLSFSIQGIFASAIMIIAYPQLAAYAAEGKHNEICTTVENGGFLINLLIMPFAVGGIVLAEPLVSLVYNHGEFGAAALQTTQISFALYMLGVLPMSIRLMFERTFFALKDSKTPMINSLISVVTNIILSIVLGRTMGYPGLAIATTTALILSMILMFTTIRFKLKELKSLILILDFAKILVSALAMGGMVFIVDHFLLPKGTNEGMRLICGVFCGLVTYLLTVFAIYRPRNIIKRIKGMISYEG